MLGAIVRMGLRRLTWTKLSLRSLLLGPSPSRGGNASCSKRARSRKQFRQPQQACRYVRNSVVGVGPLWAGLWVLGSGVWTLGSGLWARRAGLLRLSTYAMRRCPGAFPERKNAIRPGVKNTILKRFFLREKKPLQNGVFDTWKNCVFTLREGSAPDKACVAQVSYCHCRASLASLLRIAAGCPLPPPSAQ